MLGHSDPSVTKRFYADVKDKERAEVFKSVGVIGNINQIQSSAFDNVSEFEWFKANKDKGACMCDGYCTKTEKGEPIIHKVFINELVKDAIVELSEKHLNELIKLGVFISMTCQELLDEE